MRAELFGSMGAWLMSAFHQLSSGKSGSGGGSAPPRAGACARAPNARRKTIRAPHNRIARIVARQSLRACGLRHAEAEGGGRRAEGGGRNQGRFLPSALCPLPSALCPLPSALCALPSLIPSAPAPATYTDR